MVCQSNARWCTGTWPTSSRHISFDRLVSNFVPWPSNRYLVCTPTLSYHSHPVLFYFIAILLTMALANNLRNTAATVIAEIRNLGSFNNRQVVVAGDLALAHHLQRHHLGKETVSVPTERYHAQMCTLESIC